MELDPRDGDPRVDIDITAPSTQPRPSAPVARPTPARTAATPKLPKGVGLSATGSAYVVLQGPGPQVYTPDLARAVTEAQKRRRWPVPNVTLAGNKFRGGGVGTPWLTEAVAAATKAARAARKAADVAKSKAAVAPAPKAPKPAPAPKAPKPAPEPNPISSEAAQAQPETNSLMKKLAIPAAIFFLLRGG